MEDGISLSVDVLSLLGDFASTVARPRPSQHQTVSIILLGSMSRTEENGCYIPMIIKQIKGAALVMRWPSSTITTQGCGVAN